MLLHLLSCYSCLLINVTTFQPLYLSPSSAILTSVFMQSYHLKYGVPLWLRSCQVTAFVVFGSWPSFIRTK